MVQTDIREIATHQIEEGKTQIEERIFNIRGKQVMIDKDLALLYGVETKRLNEQVKRNIERFPEDFMFQLTQEECLRSQIATLNVKQGQNIKYLPFAFTENGIAMLSSVLRSETAIAVNIKIMRTFSKAHDRFLIIDDAVYLVGASIKDLGKKWFGFTLMENTVAEELLGRM